MNVLRLPVQVRHAPHRVHTVTTQITVGLEEDTVYKVYVNGANVGEMKTNLSGKLNLSVELASVDAAEVKIVK